MTSSLKPSKEDIEKLIFIRHAEKPAKGLGLLTCKGINRSLKLPDFFQETFQLLITYLLQIHRLRPLKSMVMGNGITMCGQF